jgi:DNA helicase-2/ATP-dependent DNA helicase PcrA
LLDAGLPLTFGTARPLSDEEPLRSLIAGLRLVANPRDPISLRILAAHQAGNGLRDATQDFLKRCPELAALAAREGIPRLMETLAATAVLIDRSKQELAIAEMQIRESAAEYGGDLEGFLARVSLCARESEGPRSVQRVSLLTFHAAKGLEFPVVFIAGAEEGITPLRASAGAPPRYPAGSVDLQEERRLFYVAVTRARDILSITQCRARKVQGAPRAASPSRYLQDIPGLQHEETAVRPSRADTQLTLFG